MVALSCALAAASGCDYDERRLRVSQVAVDNEVAGFSGVGGMPDSDAGAPGKDAQEAAGEAGQASFAGAADGGNSGRAGNAGMGGTTANSGGSHAGSGGAFAGASSATAGSGDGTAVSSGGTAGSHSAPVTGPCGDIDGNQIDDCSETLLQNSRFDLNLEHWSAEAQVTTAWDAQNATASTASGCAKLTNTLPVASLMGWTMAGAEQCLQVQSGLEYQIATRVFIPAGQGQGQAGINLWVFGGDDCKSNFLVAVTPAITQTVGVWTTAQGAATLPAGAKSMIVRLVVSKPFVQADLQVSFDDVLVRPY